MKIAIDLTSLYGRKITGLEVYGIELYKALLSTKEDIIPIFNTENTIDDNENAYIIKQPNRLVLENISLSRALRRLKPDAALFPIFPPPFDSYLIRNVKIIPTIHDTAFKKFHKTLNNAARFYYTPKYNMALKFADGIVTISQTVERQLALLSKKPILNLGNEISADYRDVDLSDWSGDIFDKINVERGKYFISVSTIEPRKNFPYLLKIFKTYIQKHPAKLVLVGRMGWGDDLELKSLIEELSDSLVFPGFLDFRDLYGLYRYSKAFFLLSLDEGFGRTPLEAIAAGCKKIIVSDIPIFHEILGENANYLPLNDINGSCDIIENMDSMNTVKRDVTLPFDVLASNVNELITFISGLQR
jgi:glycosyltransferase involved in cell wall biosynthesis